MRTRETLLLTLTDTDDKSNIIRARLDAEGQLSYERLAEDADCETYSAEFLLETSGKSYCIDGDEWRNLESEGASDLIIQTALETGDINEKYLDWAMIATAEGHSPGLLDAVFSGEHLRETAEIPLPDGAKLLLSVFEVKDPKDCDYLILAGDLLNDPVREGISDNLFVDIFAAGALGEHMLRGAADPLLAVARQEALAVCLLKSADELDSDYHPTIARYAERFDWKRLMTLSKAYDTSPDFRALIESNGLRRRADNPNCPAVGL